MRIIKAFLKTYLIIKSFIISVLKKWRTNNSPLYSVLYVNDLPDELKPNVIYLLGTSGKEWLAALSCPCGCGDKIELVLNGRSPSWELVFSENGRPGLHPSVFRSVRCRSHFFLTKGQIKWCKS